MLEPTCFASPHRTRRLRTRPTVADVQNTIPIHSSLLPSRHHHLSSCSSVLSQRRFILLQQEQQLDLSLALASRCQSRLLKTPLRRPAPTFPTQWTRRGASCASPLSQVSVIARRSRFWELCESWVAARGSVGGSTALLSARRVGERVRRRVFEASRLISHFSRPQRTSCPR